MKYEEWRSVAGMIGVRPITVKYLQGGESFEIKKGYGLLILSNISTGKSALYISTSSSMIKVSGSENELEVAKNGEYVTTIKNTANIQKAITAVFVGLDDR